MANGDAARHSLYAQLENVLGHEHADTLMSYLPHDQNDQVATRGDIARLGERMDRFEERMDRFGETLVSQQQLFARSMVGSMVALTAIFTLVVALLG